MEHSMLMMLFPFHLPTEILTDISTLPFPYPRTLLSHLLSRFVFSSSPPAQHASSCCASWIPSRRPSRLRSTSSQHPRLIRLSHHCFSQGNAEPTSPQNLPLLPP